MLRAKIPLPDKPSAVKVEVTIPCNHVIIIVVNFLFKSVSLLSF
jgi:hypothetical protein